MEISQQLKTLSIFHYIVGGMHMLFGCIGLPHFLFGLSMIVWPKTWDSGNDSIPTFFPWIFISIGGGFILLGIILGILTILSGRFIARRKYYTYSIVVGAINCAMFPFGTVLGVFDVILLSQKDIVLEYENSKILPV